MNKINYFFTVSYAAMLLISTLLLTLNIYIEIPFFYNVSSIYTNAKVMFISFLIIGIIGYFTFGKKLKNYAFSLGVTTALAPILFVSLSYVLDNLLQTNYLINHILSFLFTSMISFYIAYIFIISQIKFKFQNLFGLITVFYLICSFSFLPNNYNYHIYMPINEIKTV